MRNSHFNEAHTYEADVINAQTPLERAMADESESYLETSQLPAVEEYKSQVAASRARAHQVLARDSYRPRSFYTESKRKKKDCMLLIGGVALMMVLVIIISVSVGVGVGKNETVNVDEFGSALPTSRPTHSYDSQTSEILDFVISAGWSNEAEARKQSSPQFFAANWIADFDPLQLDVANTLNFRQRYALAVFWFALDGDAWRYKDSLLWLSEADVCDWRVPLKTKLGGWVEVGVRCHGGQEVKELYLPSWGIRGEIPRELGILTGLESISLWENDLIGSFPVAFQQLTNLQFIDLHNNYLEGALPDWLSALSQLTSLNLAQVFFVGTLPDLSRLSLLETINIGGNNITDNVEKLAPLSNIRNLIVSSNNLYGELNPDLKFQWPLIEIMDMSDNKIAGSLPGNLLSMEHLEIIDLSSNDLYGSIPDIVRPASQAVFLALQNNKLSGNFDILTTHMKALTHIDLSNNQFKGTVPEDWSGMTKLRYLFLSYNDFIAGSVPTSLTSLSKLEDLSLQGTNRQGNIPSGFGNITSLTLLDFSYNTLQGEIPTDVGDATNLRFLFLNRNELSGEVPGAMAYLQQLNSLLLDHNQFTSMSTLICEYNYGQLEYFIADCVNIGCPDSCCTVCCADESASGASYLAVNATQCNSEPWLGTFDPLSEYEFRRYVYEFHDNDIIFPGSEAAVTATPVASPVSSTPALNPTATQLPTRGDAMDSVGEPTGEDQVSPTRR